MDDKEQKIIMRLLMRNGYKNQLIKTVEELTELANELQQHVNKDINNRSEIVEEYVDVMFMMKQLKYIFNINNFEINTNLNKKMRKIEEVYI